MKTYGRKSRGRQKYDTTLNFDLICRLCLSEDGEMKDVFQEEEDATTPIPLKIMSSVALPVYENDGLPTQVCQQCFEQVEKFHFFKLKCEESDVQLRKALRHKRCRESGEVAEEEDDERDVKPVEGIPVVASTSASKPMKLEVKPPRKARAPAARIPTTKSMDELLVVCEKQRGDAQVSISTSGNYVIDVGDLDDKTSDSVETVVFDIDLPSGTSRSDKITQQYVGLVDSQQYVIEVDDQDMEEHYLEVEEEVEGDMDGDHIVLIRRSVKHEEEDEEEDDEEEMEEYGNGNTGRGREQGEQQLLVPFECEHCPKRFSKRIDLRRHLSVHQEKKVDGLSQGFDCPTCEKWFPNATTLKRHERSHTGERPFACPHCNKRFSQAGIMQRHILTHTGYKPFTCTHCPKGFTQREGLKVHLRTHEVKNPEEISLHDCPLCDKSFCHPSGLSRHLLVHTGKTFNCDICGKSFTDPSSLKRHVRKHTEDANQSQ